MKKLGIDIDDDASETVFHMMDPEGDGSIRFDELVWAYYNQHLAQSDSHGVTRAPTRCIAPWVPNAKSLASKEAVSIDRRHAYVNALAPYEEHYHDHLVESSKKNARALQIHHGARFASLGATGYKLRQQLYSPDNFLHAPRASTMTGDGGVPHARESKMPPSNRFGPTAYFRGQLAATDVLLRPGTA